MKHWIALLLAAVLVVGMAPAVIAQGQGQDKGKGNDPYKGDPNRGQVVSECNRRANDRDLKGQDRKDFVEWCESRGARYQYDDDRYGKERDCYQKASKKGLSGDKRANFLGKCLADTDAKYYGDKAPNRQKD